MSIKTWLIDFLGGKIVDENRNSKSIINEVTAEIYYKELALQAGINLIANAISQCTIRVYKNNKEIFEAEHYILNIRPNVNENSSRFWHKAIERMIYKNECLIVNINGNLYIADSYSEEEFPILGNTYSNIVIGNLTLNKKFKANEVILLKLSNGNIKKLVDNLYKSYGEMLNQAMESYKISNKEKYALYHDNVKVGDKVFNEKYFSTIQRQMQAFLSNDKVIIPLYKGQELREFSVGGGKSSNDFRELMDQIFQIVAQSLNIPTGLFYGKIDDLNETMNQFLTLCIEPIASMIGEELTYKLNPTAEAWQNGNYVRVDTSDIRHVNILEMATAIDKLISSGAYSINDILKITGFNEIDEEYANIHWMTKNYATINEMLKSTKDNINNVKGGEEIEDEE